MNISVIKNCTGCGACSSVCPVSAIYSEMSNDGFFVAHVNDNMCVNCGKCLKACVAKNDNEEYKHSFVNCTKFSALIKDKTQLKNVASGGVATGIYKAALIKGYKVIGCYYDKEDNIVKAKICDKEADICILQGSKYLQAYSFDVINAALKSEDNFCVIGTPCQVYAFKKSAKLNNAENRFIFVDVFCHGVPSYLLWKKYLTEEINNEKLEYISFRDKEHGWREYCLKLQSANHFSEKVRSQSDFYRAYDDGYLMNSCCYNCDICQGEGYSDIRIGDLWDEKYCSDGVSRSAVCIGSEKGSLFWGECKDYFETCEITRNAPLKNYYPRDWKKIRNYALNRLKIDEPIKKTIKLYRRKEPLKKRVIRCKLILDYYFLIKKCVGGRYRQT